MSKKKQTYNPCDDCPYSYSKNNQESGMCKICEFTYFRDHKQSGWISVDERLPERSGEYLTCRCGDLMTVLRYSARHKLFNALDDRDKSYSECWAISVTHWMPLPDAPKGGAE